MGDDELDCGGNFENEVVTDEGPTMVVESVNVGPTVGVESNDVGPTEVEESVNVGPTVLEEGLNNGPIVLNMGVNESGPSGVVNDFGPPIDEHEEYRDEYVHENGSKGDGNESEDSALGVGFGDPEEEVLCGDDGFGDAVGEETQQDTQQEIQQEDDLFADWINEPFENFRNVEEVNEVVTETERVTDKDSAEAGQSKDKGKEASGRFR